MKERIQAKSTMHPIVVTTIDPVVGGTSPALPPPPRPPRFSLSPPPAPPTTPISPTESVPIPPVPPITIPLEAFSPQRDPRGPSMEVNPPTPSIPNTSTVTPTTMTTTATTVPSGTALSPHPNVLSSLPPPGMVAIPVIQEMPYVYNPVTLPYIMESWMLPNKTWIHQPTRLVNLGRICKTAKLTYLPMGIEKRILLIKYPPHLKVHLNLEKGQPTQDMSALLWESALTSETNILKRHAQGRMLMVFFNILLINKNETFLLFFSCR